VAAVAAVAVAALVEPVVLVVPVAQAVVAGQSLQASVVVLPRLEPPAQSRLPGALRQAEAQTEAVALRPWAPLSV
jgi:hypothetical protein